MCNLNAVKLIFHFLLKDVVKDILSDYKKDDLMEIAISLTKETVRISGLLRFLASYDGVSGFRCPPNGKTVVTKHAIFSCGVVKLGLDKMESMLECLLNFSDVLKSLENNYLILISLYSAVDFFTMLKPIDGLGKLANHLKTKLKFLLERYDLKKIAEDCIRITNLRDFDMIKGFRG